MRPKLALIIALAGFAVVTALGVGMAGADPSTGLGERQAASGLTVAPALPSAKPPACDNEVDDDGDGLTDLEDPDCDSAADTSEKAEAEAGAPDESEEGEDGAKQQPTGKAKSGTALNAAEAPDEGNNGVKRNQGLGGPAGESGAVTAPSATAGDQPPSEGADGGSQFGKGGAPTEENPSTTIAPFGPAPIGVPNFVIDSFEIPPFLLPIYQACGTEYGIPWEVLASINKIETAFGTNLDAPGRRDRLDAVPALDLGDLRRRRQRQRPQGPLQPGRRDLRRGQLPQGQRRGR